MWPGAQPNEDQYPDLYVPDPGHITGLKRILIPTINYSFKWDYPQDKACGQRTKGCSLLHLGHLREVDKIMLTLNEI